MKKSLLKINSSGSDVVALQSALAERGFNPGAQDGMFGQATAAAVAAFQESEGLLIDGEAGPRTLSLLDLCDNDDLPDVRAQVSVQVVSQMFPDTRIDNIKRYLPPVLDALGNHGLGDKIMVLAALATIRAETEAFLPVDEGISRYNTSPSSRRPYDLYDYKKSLGNQGPPDGDRFHGRGFIQLTGRDNYAHYGTRLTPSQDLLNAPERANMPECAANILALFLADKQIKIKQALLQHNFILARKQVNNGSNGLERFTSAYLVGEKLINNGFQ
ncbi:peptidoglycan-binding protein [Janthinobacterium sp. BJB1]|uniref:peptidoglycan-binding protein n=1 Tax=Janthinobacterium sp. GW458P TaxID=1981504 RepID=UPI000A3233EE|nr:peptidoglycan-binding protein [Janthinobacterium sp. GW458P]MBE3024047.1 peptidoglycan-binding protein [Janthinobacterium sp. GW458P]PHV18339.1 peptidoglycan-binding protein [Janthinobacterium sp. BJB303]PJC99109.1 peptidoglycan-binding protein [Janthinobacterium sp. BJB1]